MVIFHIILRYESGVLYFLFCHEIHRVGFLQECISHVFFIAEHFVYYRGMPFVLPCGGLDSLLFQMLCDFPGTVAFQIKAEDQLYNLCLFGYDDQIPILVFGVSHELCAVHDDLAFFKFPHDSPADVLADVAALLLRQAAQDGDKDFSGSLQCIDSLFLEHHRHVLFLQFSDGHQRVYRVPRKPADRLCKDHVDLSGKGILYHGIKVCPLFGVCSTLPVICIDAGIFPVFVFGYLAGIILHLCLIAAVLLFQFRTDTAVGSDLHFLL